MCPSREKKPRKKQSRKTSSGKKKTAAKRIREDLGTEPKVYYIGL